jgi:hypothetical protein
MKNPDLLWMMLGLPIIAGFYAALAFGMLP